MSRRRGGVSIGRSYRRYHGIGGAIYRSETETKVSWRFAPLRHILTARLSPHERASKSLTTVFRARDYRRIRDSAYASVDGGSDMQASLASVVDELSRLRDQLEKEVANRQRAEAALLESERESRLFVDRIPGLVATLTPGGDVEGVNNQVLEYCGRTLEELKQWGTSDTVHPEDLPRVIEVITQSMASGDPHEIEERIRRFDGVYRWFQVRGLPLRDSNGRIVRWYVLLSDIDDRKRAEAQLAGEKRLLEMVASSCPLTDVLTALCKFVEDTSADCHCGVYLIDWSGPKFRIGAVPSLPATFNDPVDGLTVSQDVGPCGAAALTKTQVIATDLESD